MNSKNRKSFESANNIKNNKSNEHRNIKSSIGERDNKKIVKYRDVGIYCNIDEEFNIELNKNSNDLTLKIVGTNKN